MEKARIRDQWRRIIEEAKAHPGLYRREEEEDYIGDQTVDRDLIVDREKLVGRWRPLFCPYQNFFASSVR